MQARTPQRARAVLCACMFLSLADAAAGDGELVFRHTVSGEVLDVTPSAGERATAAVKRFQTSGSNPYVGNAKAVARGEQLYASHCLVCHGPEGDGKMGPNLVDDRYLYPQNRSDKGLFESIYGGTVNLMTGWKGRLSQDEILKIIAYLRSLQEK